MNLVEYASSEEIFIDANIFLDYAIPHPAFGELVKNFLEKVEIEQINAVTTPAVLSEVSHVLLLETGAVILKNHNRNIVMRKMETDRRFSSLCRDAVDKFNDSSAAWMG
ncbi:MAG: hypothetical protein A4E48_01462 [Methanosaeta sp. PtaU1.Bin060]|nr:MAG: hypothetical protein A4E48_01462 [Methanosaeta sp. PtaU1.Bin060]